VTALRNRRGIALPVTIFIITLMTITLAAAFARVGAEREVATGASEAISALTVAQSGLQRYLGVSTSRPPDGDSVRFNVTGGYADVVARIVESDSLDDQKTMYVLRSTGYVIVPAQGATAQGKRTVAQFAQWQVGNIRAVAAFVAGRGLRSNRYFRSSSSLRTALPKTARSRVPIRTTCITIFQSTSVYSCTSTLRKPTAR